MSGRINLVFRFPITVPQLSAFDDLALDGLALTLLIFAIHNRLALLIGKEQKYNVEMQTVSFVGKKQRIFMILTGTNHFIINRNNFIIFWCSSTRWFIEQKYDGIACWSKIDGWFNFKKGEVQHKFFSCQILELL